MQATRCRPSTSRTTGPKLPISGTTTSGKGTCFSSRATLTGSFLQPLAILPNVPLRIGPFGPDDLSRGSFWPLVGQCLADLSGRAKRKRTDNRLFRCKQAVGGSFGCPDCITDIGLVNGLLEAVNPKESLTPSFLRALLSRSGVDGLWRGRCSVEHPLITLLPASG